MTQAERDFYAEFEWLQPLAEGGMGTVYLAEDKKKNNLRCVIKQMRSGEARSVEELEEAKRLFKREVEILKSLEHPGIVRFLDHHVTNDGRYFLVMEYVTGNNLETILHNYNAFSQDDAIKVGIQICEVLEHLHEHDPPIIYRDLKPSNLMLTPDGQIVFIDFGIARILMPQDTATRVVTAGYSPPEQYFGKPQIKSDLYALGATLAHLVTNVRPRPLITSFPSQQGADVSESFDNLIAQLTAHSPDERPGSARIVRHTLYKIYEELHPDFEIPDEVFATQALSQEDQYISQKIMKSGLRAASSASQKLPAQRGPKLESYTDEEMPSAIARIFEGLNKQRLSSQKVPRFDPDVVLTAGGGSDKQTATKESTPKTLRDTFDRHGGSERSFWQKLVRWVKGGD